MFKTLLFLFLLIDSVCCLSQTIINATIKDSKTKETLSYCNVSIKGTYKGTISNADGVFSISAKTTDILVFSYLGYESISIPAETIIKKPIVILVKRDMIIEEVTVHAGNDYLFDILQKCRKKLLENKVNTKTKIYYGIETKTKEQPVELLECYYTGILEGEKIEELKFKNGRVALATVDSNYFETFNTAKALSKLSLTKKNDYYPSVPLEFGKNEMKKHFEFEMQDFDNNMFHLKFTPKKDKDCFAGEIWIEKGSFNILKISLKVENAKTHPFEPMHEFDAIFDVCFNIDNTYNVVDNTILLDHIIFDYNLKYKSVRDTTIGVIASKSRLLNREIFSKGIIRIYDYGNPFILPYFDYPDNLYYGDYYKMSFIPYNNVFWSNANIMLLTEEQKQNLGFFADKGQLINYFNEDNCGSNFLKIQRATDECHRHFAFYYPFWSAEKRIIFKNDLINNKTYDQELINTKIQSDLYSLVVQILLDVNQIGDSLSFRTYTVFDVFQSFYHLTSDDYTNAYINIYFDICEIERRKLDKKLHEKNYTVDEVDKVYKTAIEDMYKITRQYQKEVDLGDNNLQFEKWNQYVFDNLGIDNIKMVEETIKSKNLE